jgi:peptidyl-prolyl cis-trans isomerase B (cyclophilin B)
MKYLATVMLLSILLVSCGEKEEQILIQTDLGNIRIRLFDETPLHKENFLKLANEGFYDGLLFHRCVQGFMIQGGDPDSRTAVPNQPLGNGGPGYTIPAEIQSKFFHKRGMVAAARLGDDVNPNRESSGSQFYIVQGRTFAASELTNYTMAFSNTYTAEQIEAYTTVGGAPHLDGAYTIFGEVVEGMDVVDKIAAQPTNAANRPMQDVKMTVKVVKVKK